MSSSLNKVQLIGYLGRDPEVRTMQDGRRVTNLAVATSETWKDKVSGERKERTEWHRVSVYADGLSGIAEKYLRKGSRVYVEGQLQTRKYTDRDGLERHSTEVVLTAFNGTLKMLDSSRNGERASSREFGDDEYAGADAGYAQRGRAPANDLDDDIPF